MDINVEKEINSSDDSAQLQCSEDNIEEVKIEDVDIAEQFLDDTGIHDKKEWMIRNINLKNPKQQMDENLDCSARLEESKIKNSTFCDQRKAQTCKKAKMTDHIINWPLLIRSVKQRPVVWNKFLDVCNTKIAKTTEWRDICLIVKKKFEEMAEEEHEILDQSESEINNLTVFGKDHWGIYFYLKNPIGQEEICLTSKSNSVNSPLDGSNEFDKSERNSATRQLIPSQKPKYLTSTSDNGIDSRENTITHKYSTRNFCYYCRLPVTHFCRHMARLHSHEKEVEVILSKPKKSKIRKDLLTSLRKKGNYLKSVECSKPIKVPPNKDATKYNLCPHCLGFYSRRFLYRHIQNCDGNPHLKSNSNNSSPSLDRPSYIHWELRKKVFPRMRSDMISIVAQQDKLICEFGARYLRSHSQPKKVQATSQKMRQLSKLLIKIKKKDSTVVTIIDILQPEFYDAILEATRKIAKYDEEKKIFKSPSYAILIGVSLRQCCEIAIENVQEGSYINPKMTASEVESAIRIFSNLLKGWKDDMFLKTSNIDLESDIGIHSLHDIKTSLDENEEETDCQNVLKRENCDETYVESTKIHENYVKSKSSHIGNQKRKRKKLIPWTNEQKEVVKTYFATHIKTKKPPKRHECEHLIAENAELLENKDWLKIKVFIQNVYTKKYKC